MKGRVRLKKDLATLFISVYGKVPLLAFPAGTCSQCNCALGTGKYPDLLIETGSELMLIPGGLDCHCVPAVRVEFGHT